MNVYEVWYYSVEINKSESYVVSAENEQQAAAAMLAIAQENKSTIRILSVRAI